MKYIYGPVNSRRLGLSLGLSLTPYKTCNFDCVYCQLGQTTLKTGERKEYIKIEKITQELRSWLAANPKESKELNYITFSGMGEPTLNVKISLLISEIRNLTSVPIALITNSAHLSDPLIRKEINSVDLIVPSLDAVTQEIFEKVDRPAPGINVKDIIAGLINLRKEYRGKIWLEVMLIKGINDDLKEIEELKKAIKKINPDKIQLNSPVRATAEKNALPVDREKLQKFKKILGEKCEII